MTSELSKPRSDLGVRTLSAIVMVAMAGGALWLGGWAWTAFVLAVGLGVLWEYWGLARKIAKSWWGRALWLAGGVVYIGVAMWMLLMLSNPLAGAIPALIVIAMVIAVDVGAYLAGRIIGGPKIAPRISPSKTWAGLAGGIVAANLLVYGLFYAIVVTISDEPALADLRTVLAKVDVEVVATITAAGFLYAIIAQAGDFFESWMKRRAGVKDSGTLIPGHGGLFDRVDGLLAVLFVFGLIGWVVR